MNGQHFYIVESQTEAGKESRVEYNRQYKALSCTCKAGENGVPCWHKRAAMAAEEHYKATQRVQRANEQAEVEVTKEYQFEQLLRELEDTLDALDALAAESDERDALRSSGVLA
jgi:molecular chaperone GrpE (heat shock protein)